MKPRRIKEDIFLPLTLRRTCCRILMMNTVIFRRSRLFQPELAEASRLLYGRHRSDHVDLIHELTHSFCGQVGIDLLYR